MIDESKFSTIESRSRYGGLLICGLNYGVEKGGNPTDEMERPPWAPYFTHEENRKGDRFVGRLNRWFEWWNIPLEVPRGTPTELNLSISQTNLFYDKTKSFRHQSAIKKLDASGVLLTSTTLVNEAARHFQVSAWQISRSGRFVFQHSRTGDLHIAVCPHPRYPQKRPDVEFLSGTVREWVESVLREYAKKQQGRTSAMT